MHIHKYLKFMRNDAMVSFELKHVFIIDTLYLML